MFGQIKNVHVEQQSTVNEKLRIQLFTMKDSYFRQFKMILNYVKYRQQLLLKFNAERIRTNYITLHLHYMIFFITAIKISY